MKGDDDMTGAFLKRQYICLILTFCGETKKERLLRKNYLQITGGYY
jgi:hypothetical protein